MGLISLFLGAKNLIENEQQSESQLKILKQNDVGEANDKQAAYLLEELGRKFDEQNRMLRDILEEVKNENHKGDSPQYKGGDTSS